MSTNASSHFDEQERLPIGRDEPILQELWQIKAQINAEAAYDVNVLAEHAHNWKLSELASTLTTPR